MKRLFSEMESWREGRISNSYEEIMYIIGAKFSQKTNEHSNRMIGIILVNSVIFWLHVIGQYCNISTEMDLILIYLL